MLTRLKRAAVLTRLVGSMRRHGSWAGETHVQKACFFLQELLQVPLGFKFILYRHGPFSFDLRDELTSLRADELLVLEPQPMPYGPKMADTPLAASVQARFPNMLAKYDQPLDFVVRKLGDKGVASLERLATALYVCLGKSGGKATGDRADHLCRLKPHVPPEGARAAIEEVDQIIGEAQGLGSDPPAL